MTLHNIVAKLGGDLWAGGAQANIPGPGHSAHDRSVTLQLGRDGRVVVNTWGRTPWWEVMDDLRERGLIDDNKMPVSAGGRARSAYPQACLDGAARLRVAEAIWRAGTPLTSVSLEVVRFTCRHRDLRQGRDRSGRHVWQADERIVAMWRWFPGSSSASAGPSIHRSARAGWRRRRTIAASLGKMPTTSVRRLISPFSRSSGLVECSLARWAGGKVM